MHNSLINSSDLSMLKDVLEHYLVQSNVFIAPTAPIDDITSRRASRWILHKYQQMSQVESASKHAINGIILACMVEVMDGRIDPIDTDFPAVCLGEFSALLEEAMRLHGQATRPDQISSLLTSYHWTHGLEADFYVQLSDLEDLIDAISPVRDEVLTEYPCVEGLCDYYTLAYFSHIPRGDIHATNTRILVRAAKALINHCAA